ncbi:MAG: amidohydrolase [Thermovirgaceae bacterium]|nr:amidohydrolase [Thermovirgaceae bacterium]
MRLLLKNMVYIDSEMVKAECGDILVEDGMISSIGLFGKTERNGLETFDGKGKTLVMPGFVNSHTHAAMVLLRGLGEELPLKEWLEERIWPVEAALMPEHVYWGTRGAIAEMASSGTTCFTDMYFEMDQVADAALHAGMRCCISRGIIGDDPKKMEEGIDLFRRRNGKGNVRVQLAPHAPYTVSLEAVREISAAAKSLGAGIHFHFLEAEWERSFLKDKLGLYPFAYLENTELLDLTSTILAHCVWFPPEDIPKLKGTSVTIAHNPSSNMKLGSGFAPVPAFLAGGADVSLGTDGAASNNRLDMWGEMRLCALIHKGITMDPTAVTARSVFKMATVAGARAAGFDDVGLIREGWQADLILVDLDKPQYEGWTTENLFGFIVYAGSSRDISGTIAAGRWLYRGGRFMDGEYEEVKRQISRCRKELVCSGNCS